MKSRMIALSVVLALLGACTQDTTLELPGNTEWDRISLLAETSERILDWQVAEGDRVEAGDVLLTLDARRMDARIDEAKSRLSEAEARLTELRTGPRTETIARARAELASAQAAVVEADLEYVREADLLERALTSQSTVDRALAVRDQRRAAAEAAKAVLDELIAGTRSEQIEQAVARTASLKAQIDELHLTRERYEVRAPRDGRVDALPFKPGDQPRAGDVVATLLVGDRPIARIFVPASIRAGIAENDLFDIRVEGVTDPFRARLRSIRSEASFTPYYALTGDDASRLVYRAELVFEDAAAADLPAGLPLVATPVAGS